jgi:arylformamidase
VRIYDVSLPIRPGMVVYDGNPGVEIERVQSIADGASSNISRLGLGAHTGTHVDAPLHFMDGWPGSEAIPLEPLVGPAHVVDATQVQGKTLGEAELLGLDLPEAAERIIFKTRNSQLWASDEFTRDFIRLEGSGARFLLARGVRLVGIDYLSIGDGEAHVALLEAGVVPLEGLDLRKVEPGEYRLVCLPLRLVGSDGAPSRAILIRE